MILVWVGVTLLTFVIANVIPSDPVALRLGPKATAESIQYWRHQYGLDQPLPQQYFQYLVGLFHGDLGLSVWSGRPVIDDLGDYLPATIELAFAAFIFSIVLGVPLGIFAAGKPNSFLDKIIQILSSFGLALPLFWLGLLLQLLFYRDIGLLPLDSRIDLVIGPPIKITGFYFLDSLLKMDWVRFFNSFKHLILPAITLSLPSLGAITRMVRGNTLDVLSRDYVRMARAKGASSRRVMWKHVLRNAMLPVVTLMGNIFNSLIAGVFVVEVVFNWPGLGWYATKTILASDYSAVVSITLIIAVISTTINLLIDLTYRILDPRIQLT
jgi:peptide/nickel transport system permease protein